MSQDKTTFMGFYLDELYETVTIPGGWGTLPVLSAIDHRYRKYTPGSVNAIVIPTIGAPFTLSMTEGVEYSTGTELLLKKASDENDTIEGIVISRIGTTHTVAYTAIPNHIPT